MYRTGKKDKFLNGHGKSCENAVAVCPQLKFKKKKKVLRFKIHTYLNDGDVSTAP